MGGLTGNAYGTVLNNGGGTSTLTVAGNGTFNGLITDNGGSGNGKVALTVSGTGTTCSLGGTNTYSGPTTLNGGSVDLVNQYAIQNSTLTMTGSGSVIFDQFATGNGFLVGGLAASQSGNNIALQTNGAPAAIPLSVGYNNASTTYAGVLSGPGSLTKVGSGMLTLTGSNVYTGGTTVSGGTLQVVNGNALGFGGPTSRARPCGARR